MCSIACDCNRETELSQTHVSSFLKVLVLLNFLVTVKAASHECAIRTGQTKTKVKAENEAWF